MYFRITRLNHSEQPNTGHEKLGSKILSHPFVDCRVRAIKYLWFRSEIKDLLKEAKSLETIARIYYEDRKFGSATEYLLKAAQKTEQAWILCIFKNQYAKPEILSDRRADLLTLALYAHAETIKELKTSLKGLILEKKPFEEEAKQLASLEESFADLYEARGSKETRDLHEADVHRGKAATYRKGDRVGIAQLLK
ncbi:MAG: hypothetical protein PHS02_02735 [Candidatus ainarchaeum sp.]|nr:hypothetical protein [Candidatus ainarchaeum sp.]